MRLRDPQGGPAYVGPSLASACPPGKGLPFVPPLNAGLSHGKRTAGKELCQAPVNQEGLGVSHGSDTVSCEVFPPLLQTSMA